MYRSRKAIGALTPVERALVEHFERGELLDLAGDEPVDEPAMRAWGAERTVRARVVRDIVRGRLVSDPDPRGLRLRGARIEGRVDLENIISSFALELTDCLLGEGLVARDAVLPGFNLSGSRLEHPSEPALDTVRLTTPVLLLRNATIEGHCSNGAMITYSANVSSLDCAGATLLNHDGPALHADALRAHQGVFLNRRFDAHGAGDLGTIRLVDAHIGRLDCGGATLENRAGPALDANGLKVDRSMNLDNALKVSRTGPGVVIDLTGVQVGGALSFAPDGLQDRTSLLRVDGLTYSGLPAGISTAKWLDLLRDSTPAYAAQPYQQLAAAHRAAGHDGQARRILMAQRRDQIHRRALTGPAERHWAQLTGLLLGYGYQPWRALIGLLLVVGATITLAVILGGHGGLVQIQPASGAMPRGCAVIDRIGVGLDLGAPLITSRARCEATYSATGLAFTITGTTLRLLAWAFATLFIAGFTSAVRKT